MLRHGTCTAAFYSNPDTNQSNINAHWKHNIFLPLTRPSRHDLGPLQRERRIAKQVQHVWRVVFVINSGGNTAEALTGEIDPDVNARAKEKAPATTTAWLIFHVAEACWQGRRKLCSICQHVWSAGPLNSPSEKHHQCNWYLFGTYLSNEEIPLLSKKCTLLLPGSRDFLSSTRQHVIISRFPASGYSPVT